MACILWSSAVKVHDSHAYRKMDVKRESVSHILELREILLSFQTCFSLVHAAVVYAILASILGLEPSSVIIEPRYLKLVTVSSFCPFTNQWTIKGYIRARNKHQSISYLFCMKVMKLQKFFKIHKISLNTNVNITYKHQTQIFKEIINQIWYIILLDADVLTECHADKLRPTPDWSRTSPNRCLILRFCKVCLFILVLFRWWEYLHVHVMYTQNYCLAPYRCVCVCACIGGSALAYLCVPSFFFWDWNEKHLALAMQLLL